MESVRTRTDDTFRWPHFLVAVLLILAAFVALYAGFIVIRDSQISPLFTAVFAIVWGVGGVLALFYVGNNFVEKLPHGWSARLQPFIFVGPAIVLLAWYLAIPTVRTLVISLQDSTTNGFVGLQNYVDIFSSRIVQEAFTNNLLWMVVGTALVVAFGLLIAVLADRSSFENIAKSLIFLPLAISMVGAGIIWKFIYDFNPNIGMLSSVVQGAGGAPQDWLRQVQPWNNIFLIIVMVWLQTGYAMVLFSAAIKGIPDELLEAARVDGAGEIRIFFKIIVPSISGTIVVVVTTVIIFTLKLFDIVMVMTGGQFGTEVIGVRFYREMFTNDNPGYASAIAIVLLIAVIPVMIYNLREFNKRRAF